jgi:hypothetical protein
MFQRIDWLVFNANFSSISSISWLCSKGTMTVPHLFEDSLYLISFISYICSYDVVFTASADEILEKLKKFDANVIFSAEGFCWPDRSLKV